MSKNKKNIKNKGIKRDLKINVQQSKMESEAGEETEVGRKTVIAFLLFLLIFLIPLFTETLSERKYDNQITYDVVNENNYEIILNNNRYFLDLDFDDEQYASAIKNSNIDFISLSLESKRIQLNDEECLYTDELCKNKIKSDKLGLITKIQKWSDDRVNLGVIWLSKNKAKEEELQRNTPTIIRILTFPTSKYNRVRLAVGNNRIMVSPIDFWINIFKKIIP
ncbi:hypothetical protein ACV6EX_005237 [Klebsiella pneumoniae]|uniref:hypothetical protein n=1 Tax=Enterobacteriaceae TaxID=543 RepID=UPI0015E4BE08|nr:MULTISPECIES: hypothetical protein [Enterobacteriaceae]EJO8828500.1 hypothetical protein [Salmonella enterica subsp. enterica serovar Infantis]EME4759882.1 hypothetical protein [Klebsiella pneumoniae]EKI1016359.1 hypothetical protein [Salmonella enterica subsp. enterica serovar Infantis]MBL9391525.1 hypothetical protein [Klebsiella pneumoniae]MCD9948301.1 hypothetical protein [Klebsiella pneumoniae]